MHTISKSIVSKILLLGTLQILLHNNLALAAQQNFSFDLTQNPEIVANATNQPKLTDKYYAQIEPYIQDDYLNTIIAEADQLAAKYSDDEYVNTMANMVKIKQEERRAYNNTLLYEFEFSRLSSRFKIPHVGIYTKDLLKLALTSADWFADKVLKQNLTAHFETLLFNQLTQSDAMLTTLHTYAGQTDDKKNARKALHEATQQQLKIPYKDLFSGPLFSSIVKHFIASQSIKFIKDQCELAHDTTENEPVPIFSIAENFLINGYFLSNPETGLVMMANNFFKSWGMLPAFTESTLLHYSQQLALDILFIGWLNQHIIMSQWTNYLMEHHTKLATLLNQYHGLNKTRLDINQTVEKAHLRTQKELAEEALKKFIGNGMELSFTTWIKLKNMKQAEWELYYHLIVSLPGWYRITKVAYNIIKQLTNEQPLNNQTEELLS